MGIAARLAQRSHRLAFCPSLGGGGALKRVEVVVAFLQDARGRTLMAQRPVGKVYAGYWEFPGGKVESGETHLAALVREIREELGVEVQEAYPWFLQQFDYEHAKVNLNLFRITRWAGIPQPLEDQALAWQGAGIPAVAPMLPANGVLLRALELPPVYAITQGEALGEPALLEALERAFFRGLRMVLVREKSLPAELLGKLAEKVVQAARPWRARVMIHGHVDVARQSGADGVHLSAGQLMACQQRPDLPWVAASCHNQEELAQAEALGLDFAVLGPVGPTASHPGATPLGLTQFAQWRAQCRLPLYAIGGQSLNTLGAVWQAGGQGIASLSDIWTGHQPIPRYLAGPSLQ
jgi:8-oxo-dGTP diphosphatase